MPRSPTGDYNLPPGTLVNSGDTILVSQHNPAMSDIATSIGNSLDRNGTGGMRAALDMGGYPIRNIADGVNPTDVATVAQATSSAIPIGVVTDFAGATAPSGWLLCFGQAVSRVSYADLFTALGTLYGTGDGSTTFNLPDLRGRVMGGKDDMGGSAAGRLTGGAVLGASLGSQTHTLVTAEMPAHSHGGSTGVAGDHTHSGTLAISYGGSWPNSSGIEEGRGAPDWQAGAMGNAGSHSHSITSEGSGTAHNNVQPTFILNKIIKASN